MPSWASVGISGKPGDDAVRELQAQPWQTWWIGKCCAVRTSQCHIKGPWCISKPKSEKMNLGFLFNITAEEKETTVME